MHRPPSWQPIVALGVVAFVFANASSTTACDSPHGGAGLFASRGCCGTESCECSGFLTRDQCETCDQWDVGGWISGGWTLNADGNRSGTGNAPYGYNDISDSPVMNQAWLFCERQVDSGRAIDWGFRVDYLFGTDGPDNQAFGDATWDYGWNTSRDYGSAIPQLYGNLKLNDLMLRIGYFLTPIGWESVPTTQNFFYSHSFTFYYSEPNTHSGILASYTLNDSVTLHGGYTLGMDGSFANYLDAATFLGGIDWNISSETSLAWALLAGDWGDGTGRRGVTSTQGDIYLHSLILQHQLTEKWAYVFHHDFGMNTNIPAGQTSWYAVVQYLTYEASERLHLGARLEWFRDDDGVRIGSGIADAGDYYETTLGINWMPTDEVTFRPEIRWDWARGAGLPFDAGTEDEFFTYAVNAVVTF